MPTPVLPAYNILTPDGRRVNPQALQDAINDIVLLLLKVDGQPVASNKILTGAITTRTVARNAISSPQLQDAAIGRLQLAADAVGALNIEDGAVTAAKVAAAVQKALGDTPDNMVLNGSAEEGTLGAAPTSWTTTGSVVVAEDEQKIGSRSFKTTAVGDQPNVRQSVDLEAGALYELSGWVKTDTHSNQAGRYAAVNLDTTTAITVIEKITIGSDPSSTEADCGLPFDGTARDWTFVRCRFLANATETVTVRVSGGYGAGGTTGVAWFDGVVLRRANVIYTDDLVANAITTGKITAGAVDTAQLNAGAVTTAKVAAGAITTNELTVSQLSGITADLGSITAGSLDAVTITGGTITGSTIRTASSGARIEQTTTGFQIITAGGQVPISALISSIGTMTFGDGTTTGILDMTDGETSTGVGRFLPRWDNHASPVVSTGELMFWNDSGTRRILFRDPGNNALYYWTANGTI